MTKTVKEIEQIQDIIDFICSKHQTNVDDKLIKLYEIRNKMLYYEKELTEKDKEIKKLEEQWESIVCNNYKLQQQQLYKEDFKKMANTSFSSKGHTSFTTWELKDNSLYDKLPNKEDKTCI
ncbi:hypothetical protein SKUN_001661 [Spiroplasma kunkelii CR2-3x]|uniref:Uncharacterized protein n=1 Tax=Spiroplasma kunkelii CR2-3x TaxID=273035 RepID=A0A0K2JJ95_SPIKU|nr:hypothetical protein [Spiroplasma kunkelii]ALA98518.1 hypothetical protein SKUN_001661 [Spiroplasma kunkelii CR2-3x]